MANVENLIQVKTALADKYAHRAKIAKSVAQRRRYQYHAEKYREQARMLRYVKPRPA